MLAGIVSPGRVISQCAAIAGTSILIISSAAATVEAGPAALRGELVSVDVDAGPLRNPTGRTVVGFTEVIDVGGDAPWLRVLFSEARLSPGSVIQVTSLLDGETQVLDAQALEQWGTGTAFFNGSAVVVELVLGPNAEGDGIKIDQVYTARLNGGAVSRGWLQTPPRAICEDADERSPSPMRESAGCSPARQPYPKGEAARRLSSMCQAPPARTTSST